MLFLQSLSLLRRFIPALDMSLVDPSGETGFPLTVMAFMPYLLTRYDEPTNVCLEAAQLIAEVCIFNSFNSRLFV